MRGISTHSPDDQCELLTAALDRLGVPEAERDQASIWIENVARTFQSRLGAMKNSPTLKELGDQLEQISAQAKSLARLLEKTWPYAQAAAAGYCTTDDWPGQGLRSYFDCVIDAPEKTRIALPKLTAAADQIRSKLPTPQGGERKVEARFYGLPKQRLAIECWELFHHFRPGEAKATEGGNYFIFTEIVYEMATGENSDQPGRGLDPYVKGAAMVCRDLIERRPVLERLRLALAPRESPVGFLSNSVPIADTYGIPRRLLDSFGKDKK